MASLTVLSSPTATSAATTYLLTMTTTTTTSPAADADQKPDAKSAARKSSSARRSRSSAQPARGPSVARRNERERNRVRQVNLGFATLRQHVPSRSKKMSKVETLRSAVQYIRQLRALLGEEAADEGEESCGGADENRREGSMPGFAEAFARLAPRASPAPSLGSDASSPYDSLSPEDEELMDFATWLS